MRDFASLVKAAGELDESIKRRSEDLEKKATVDRYMGYGLSYEVATGLVKTAASAKEWGELADKGVDWATQRLHGAAGSVEDLKKIKEGAEALSKKKGLSTEAKLGLGAAGVALGAGGVALGSSMSRDKNRMPEYEKRSSVRIICRTDV